MSHEAQQVLGALSMDEPFDVISMDAWHPASTKTNANATTTRNQKAILTCLDNLTGFANLAFASQVSSDMIARLAFSHFFGLDAKAADHDTTNFLKELWTDIQASAESCS